MDRYDYDFTHPLVPESREVTAMDAGYQNVNQSYSLPTYDDPYVALVLNAHEKVRALIVRSRLDNCRERANRVILS